MFDVRNLWMHQKRIIGSHFANALECLQANELVRKGIIKPVISETLAYDEIPKAHQLVYDNKHSGKIGVLIQARSKGLMNTKDVAKSLKRVS